MKIDVEHRTRSIMNVKQLYFGGRSVETPMRCAWNINCSGIFMRCKLTYAMHLLKES